MKHSALVFESAPIRVADRSRCGFIAMTASQGTANRFSTGTINIDDTGGNPSTIEFLPFTLITPTSGGGATFSNAGAIELEITGVGNVNGTAELVGTVGQTLFTQDFANFPIGRFKS